MCLCVQLSLTVKTRIMSDAAGVKFRGPLDCAAQILRHEGVGAFMKGWTASFFRLGPHFVMSMPLLELMRRVMGLDAI